MRTMVLLAEDFGGHFRFGFVVSNPDAEGAILASTYHIDTSSPDFRPKLFLV